MGGGHRGWDGREQEVVVGCGPMAEVGRITAPGKHFSLNGSPFRVRGVTYGSFRTRPDGHRFPETRKIERDFAMMQDLAINTVRTYAPPPLDLLSIAESCGLRLLVGLDYRDWRIEADTGSRVHRRVLEFGKQAVDYALELCAGHAAVMGIAVGNEIPVDLVRLHRPSAVQEVLSELVRAVHAGDSEMLATYVNFPTTEFLEVEGQDFLSFNVFLEDPFALSKYLASLQVLADAKPLLITELGLPSEVNGEQAQKDSLEWQLRSVDTAGCGGATVFSWTDEWAVAGVPVRGWGFGVTRENREPKPALEPLQRWAVARVPVDLRSAWPTVSVIVCAYNEEATIEECLASLENCIYPGLEVIVCDDGSTDRTLALVHQFPFKVLELPHGGLSTARNAGLAAATGEFVAYLDADAACHPDWPFYLVLSMEDPAVVASGGPNLPHSQAGFVERAVAKSPGSPREVLLSPERAEHVPGCNMAFRKDKLEAIGGFDPVYTSAGDDVDVCWKLLDQGHEIGFAPAAEVVHHRRSTVRGYLRQQRGYGRAERMLSGPHRHRFNRLGQARWSGFVYGGAGIFPSLFAPVIYTGYMGLAPFQPVVVRRSELASAWALALLPFVIPLVILGIGLAAFWPIWWALVGVLIGAVVVYAFAVGVALQLDHQEPKPMRMRVLVAVLHVLQPVARAWGRLTGVSAGPPAHQPELWSGDRVAWLDGLRRDLEAEGCTVRIGEPGATWDLLALSGFLTSIRIITAVAWKWEPRYRLVHRPRSPLWLLSAGAFVGFLGSVQVGLLLLAILAASSISSAIILRSRVMRAVSRSIKPSIVNSGT